MGKASYEMPCKSERIAYFHIYITTFCTESLYCFALLHSQQSTAIRLLFINFFLVTQKIPLFPYDEDMIFNPCEIVGWAEMWQLDAFKIECDMICDSLLLYNECSHNTHRWLSWIKVKTSNLIATSGEMACLIYIPFLNYPSKNVYNLQRFKKKRSSKLFLFFFAWRLRILLLNTRDLRWLILSWDKSYISCDEHSFKNIFWFTSKQRSLY